MTVSVQWVVVREVLIPISHLPVIAGYLQVEKMAPLPAGFALQPVLQTCSPMELDCVKADAWLQPWHLPSLPVWGEQVLIELALRGLAELPQQYLTWGSPASLLR